MSETTMVISTLVVIMALIASTLEEADYTLDDSFWNEESPVGEVERLLREYRQNQELVRNIGANYYQIIYPVQLRHHEKMGISTREVGAGKFSPVYSGGNTQRGRSRTGKHFHRTSLLIKAFNHKFRLDLELNTQLLAPNLVQKHFLPSGAEQVSKQEIEHCYYHGTVKDYPGATAAFHTCNGVSGVIHVGNETFVIHPFYGGDLSKHPHVIFEARTKPNKGCANSGMMEYSRRTKHLTAFVGGVPAAAAAAEARYRRDVSEATKYIETAVVIDKAMFEKRNGSTRAEVVHDAIQVANIADLYFRTLNTRVSIVYIETWQGSNQTPIDKSQDISRALHNFNDYTSRKLYKVERDTTQLLTGEEFVSGEAGISVPDTVCTPRSVGISVDVNPYELHLLAGTMAHMIGHNIGMGHDGGREECFCRDWHGCIMAQSIVGLENVQPYKFSECSRSDYNSALRTGRGICLLNKPNELEVHRTCGNSIVEDGEECDCGTIEECHEQDPCCDPITCKLTKDAQCASGPCCNNCQLRQRGVVCRDATNECDLPEHCNGETGNCPQDVHKKNGQPCGDTTNPGYCFNGFCPTLNIQCTVIWGYGGQGGDPECFKQFNSKGSINGHCGTDENKQFIKCDPENVRCGSLQCQLGSARPKIPGLDELYSRTIISMKGTEYECKTTSGTISNTDLPDMGLVRDGTPCGDNLICVNQTCTSIFPHIDQGRCPSNHNNLECSGHGTCSNINKCYCNQGWSGTDCSIQVEIIPTLEPANEAAHATSKNDDLADQMQKKETPYGRSTDNLSTLSMVFIMVGVVKGVFISFALIAVCFRKSMPPKYDQPYVKKPMPKKTFGKAANPEEAAVDSVNKIITFGNMPVYSRGDNQRAVYRPVNHMPGGSLPSRYQEHQMKQMKRHGGASGSEDDPTHSGEEESVSFIDLAPNNLSKLPEKGILKKPCPYGGDICMKEKWGAEGDSQSDNQEILSQSDNNLGPDMMAGGAISEVERTLKSLNGYHEDILEALRTAASQHRPSSATPASSSSEDLLRRSLAAAVTHGYKRALSQDKLCDGGHSTSQTHTVMVEDPSGPSHIHHHHRSNHRSDADDDEDEDVPPSCGPIRIRNLEDLIRQLEHHSARHMSPSGSEDIRMSETEADRHYRLDTQSGRVRRGEEDGRFVYGRYRQPSGRPAAPHYLAEEESIYESADPAPCPADTPDSESDDFIQAQRLVRSASMEVVGAEGEAGPSGAYVPSPPSSGDSSPAERPPPAAHSSQDTLDSGAALIRPSRYPEYKH